MSILAEGNERLADFTKELKSGCSSGSPPTNLIVFILLNILESCVMSLSNSEGSAKNSSAMFE